MKVEPNRGVILYMKRRHGGNGQIIMYYMFGMLVIVGGGRFECLGQNER